jgi:hypothetical protein
MKRRNLVLAAAGAPVLGACSSGADHAQAARDLRRPLAMRNGDEAMRMHELVRYATLAPSSHNTQCWQFRVQPGGITITPDLARRCPVVDPDDHHLFTSLGCALENLAQAALAAGLHAEAEFDPAGQGAIAVRLEPAPARASELFQAIPERQCTRGDYDGKALSVEDLRMLERAGSAKGVRLVLLTAPTAMEQVLDYVVAANTAQMNDPAFMAELKAWIRFGHAEAVQSGDGLFSGSSGNPALPRWLGSRMMDLFFTPGTENERYARQLRSSAGIAVFVAERADKAHWIEVGRCYERFALQATALGIRNAFVNQPVEVGPIRPQFAAALGLGPLRPDLVVRFGRGPVMPWSMRRPVQAVLRFAG